MAHDVVDNWAPPNLARAIAMFAVFILIAGLFSVVRGILALLGDVVLELLLALLASNFAGWLFFHASYFEKVKGVKATLTERVRQALTLVKERQEELTDERLDYWMKRISQEYATASRLDSTMNGVRNYFMLGLGVALLGSMLELVQNAAPWDTVALVISVICFIFAVLDGNAMMTVLSQATG